MLFSLLPTIVQSLQVLLTKTLHQPMKGKEFFIWHSQWDIGLLLSLTIRINLTPQNHILSQTVTLMTKS